MLVCHCMKVFHRDIQQCKSVDEVKKRTCATMGCGGCTPLVYKLVNSKEEDKK